MKREFLKKIMIVGMTTLIITSLNPVTASAKWVSDSKDNWNWTEEGVKATGWKNIDNKWYYFNEDGVMLTGWINYSKKWYNLSSDGAMNTGWKSIDGKWYYFDSDGKMSTGWVNDNGTWYYTNLSGEMVTGTLTIDGVQYSFLDNGQLVNDKKPNNENQSGASQENNEKSDSASRMGYVSTNSDVLNVRADAAVSADIIGTLPKGAQVNIIDDEKDGFYPLMLNGQKGWVSSKWISFNNSNNVIASNTDSTTSSNNNATTTTANSTTGKSYTNTGSTSSVGASNNSDNVNSLSVTNKDINVKTNSLGTIRDTAPNLDNKYYYSDDNLFYKVKLSPPFYSDGKPIKGNCTWYAWGRAWEITGIKPTDAGFIGNAYEWWEANKKSGKYQYGSDPRVGAIAVWKSSLPNSGGSGHVAVIEKIDNGKIYISESTWNGVTFRYREIYETDYLYGYIYLDKPNH